MNLGQVPEALEELSRANELYENHRWIHRDEMYCYWELREEEKAFEAFRKYYASNPSYDMETADSIYRESGFNGSRKGNSIFKYRKRKDTIC